MKCSATAMDFRAPTARALVAVPACLAFPGLAAAHPQISGGDGLARGFIHPLTGLDHVSAMLAVEVWASQLAGRALWILPAVFVSVMTIGGVLGMTGVPMPWVEPGIAASVLVLGILVVSSARLPMAVGVSLVSVFALVHGHAHGTETPATFSGIRFGAGFIRTTAWLLAAGAAAGFGAQIIQAAQWVRCAGGAAALCGLGLCFAL